jgi:hypothetical protein
LAKATETAEPITPLAPVTIIVLFFTENIAGYWILVTGYWLLDTGYLILDTGLLVPGSWILVTGHLKTLSFVIPNFPIF